MNRTLLFAIFLVVIHSSLSGQKGAIIYCGNPLFDGWYADPAIAIYENKYWVFPTFSARFDDQVFLDAFSSIDLVNWEKHPRILDTTAVAWAKRAMWAPATIKKEGKYYLFFAANDIQAPFSRWWNPDIHSEEDIGGIGVAVADRPEGPYTDLLGQPLIREFYNQAQPIDQFVFQDRDGQYYMVYGGWGRCNIVKLNRDFSGLLPFEDGDMAKEITPEGYVEGPVMFYRGDLLYFMWSEGNWADDSYNVAYAITDSPFGPFNRIGTVLDPDPAIATGAGHHEVLNIPGTDDWYIVYHRRPVPNQDRDHRVVCIEQMHFDNNGHIIPVRISVEGVKSRPLK